MRTGCVNYPTEGPYALRMRSRCRRRSIRGSDAVMAIADRSMR